MKKSKIQLHKLPSSRALELLSFFRRESGVTLVLALIIVSNILMIALAVGIFSLNQLKITISAKESAYAIFAATSGIEMALYEIRKKDDCTTWVGSDYFMLDMPVLKYSVSVDFPDVDPPDCDASSETSITSTGTYRQTSRKVGASW